MKKHFFLCFAVLFLLIVGFFLFRQTTPMRSLEWEGSLSIGGTQVQYLFADTEEERSLGLSYTKELAPMQGMLFAYTTTIVPQFWMKGMEYPLDFIWIDSNFTVVDLSENISPNNFPATIQPKLPVLYVLEVPAGFISENGISIGDTLEL